MIGVGTVRIRHSDSNFAVFYIRDVVIDVGTVVKIAKMVLVAVTGQTCHAVGVMIAIFLDVGAVVVAAPISSIDAKSDVVTFAIEKMLIFKTSVKTCERVVGARLCIVTRLDVEAIVVSCFK